MFTVEATVGELGGTWVDARLKGLSWRDFAALGTLMNKCGLMELIKRPGDRIGHHRRVPNVIGKRVTRHVLFDTNYWKSFVAARLASPIGDLGCLTLLGGAPEPHRMLAEHVTAEYLIRAKGRGRTVDEWKLRPERPDNHWLDCLVGCAVGASMEGAAMVEAIGEPKKAERKKIKLSALRLT